MVKAARGGGDKYLVCLYEALAKARYGPERTAKAIDAYQRYADGNTARGMGPNDARPEAMAQVMKDLQKSGEDKQLRLKVQMDRIGDVQARIDEAKALKQGSVAGNFYNVRLGLMQDVDFLKTTRSNFSSEKDVALGNMQGMFREVIDKFSRDWLGRANSPIETGDIAQEVLKPGSTTNTAARNVAEVLKKMYDYVVSELGLNGVRLARTIGDELTLYPNAAKLERMGKDGFVEFMKNRVDWNRSGNGYFIRPEEREQFLRDYYDAVSRDKWGDMERPFDFAGGQFARDFNNHTIFKFKDGATYAEAHTQLMDGDMLQTVRTNLERYSHNIALAKMFGPNPVHMMQVIKKMVTDAAHAAKPPGKSLGKLNRLMRRADAMQDFILHSNPMDPESTLGFVSNISSNLMSGAMLHGAFFTSVAGDFQSMLANRIRNNEAIIAPMMDYFKAFFSRDTGKSDLLAMAHTTSNYINDIYHTTHYNNLAAMAETGTKWLADKTMRLNLMTRHFDALRAADTRMRSQSLFNARFTSYDNLRERFLLENNNISPAEWDKTRKAMAEHVFQPADDVSMFRPMDHFDTLGNDLAHKWQLLFRNEGKRSVFEASLEARAIAMGKDRGDTWSGLFRKSTFQFQTYGITYGLALCRALIHGTPGDRLSAFARMGLFAVLAGAGAQQIKNVMAGKQLDPMTSPSFWIQMIANASGPWGSVMTGGMRADSASAIIKAIGGPYAEMIGDAYSNTIGSATQAMDLAETNQKWLAGKHGVQLMDLLRKYAIPQTFWTSMALQHRVIEPIQEGFDATIMHNRYRAQEKYAKQAGTPYIQGYEPGSRAILPGIPGR